MRLIAVVLLSLTMFAAEQPKPAPKPPTTEQQKSRDLEKKLALEEARSANARLDSAAVRLEKAQIEWRSAWLRACEVLEVPADKCGWDAAKGTLTQIPKAKDVAPKP